MAFKDSPIYLFLNLIHVSPQEPHGEEVGDHHQAINKIRRVGRGRHENASPLLRPLRRDPKNCSPHS